jgi:hypothetical protein
MQADASMRHVCTQATYPKAQTAPNQQLSQLGAHNLPAATRNHQRSLRLPEDQPYEELISHPTRFNDLSAAAASTV